jgi:hypothetical protein
MADHHTDSPTTLQSASWPNTQCSLLQGNTAATFLFSNHPTLHEDLIFRALEQSNGDTASASMWCSIIEKADGAYKLLCNTFPTTPTKHIQHTFKKLNGDLSKTYCSVANLFPSTWDHPVTDTWLQINALPVQLSSSTKAKKWEPDFCDVFSLFGSFWTVSARIGAFTQYDFMYGLIYRIFLVFLGLFPVGFRLFG